MTRKKCIPLDIHRFKESIVARTARIRPFRTSDSTQQAYIYSSQEEDLFFYFTAAHAPEREHAELGIPVATPGY